MAKEGSKRVEIIGKDDKHQITAVLGGTMSGDCLPVQLVYKGTTKRCLPSLKFPNDWDINYSCNHWCNEKTMLDYVQLMFSYATTHLFTCSVPRIFILHLQQSID